MLESQEPIVSDVFFAPLLRALSKAKSVRDCPFYQDEVHLKGGVNRTLSDHRTGRAWLQSFRVLFRIDLAVDCFFKALRSKRRTEMVEQVNEALIDEVMTPVGTADPFSGAKELDGFAIYATDGHSVAHSSHDDLVQGKMRANNHIFSLNLRTDMMEHLQLCLPEEGKAKEHEIAALKKLAKKRMRMRQPKGVKVVHAYDPAIIDYRFWLDLKKAGVYVVSVEKKNSALMVTGEPPFDQDDPRNAGVLNDQWVATSNQVMIRRVTYQDPVSGKVYKFLTSITDVKVPPGAIAFIYKCRWNIEKTFDESKNRFMERKSWGKSENSKCQHASFICLAHNLCVLLENKLEKEEEIVDEKSIRRQKKRKVEESRLAAESNRVMNALVEGCKVVTQRSCQFIRWLRLAIDHASPWRNSVDLLRPLMQKYLS